MPIELLPIMLPALVIVAVAVRLVRQASPSAHMAAPAAGRVLDLRDPTPGDVVPLRSAPAAIAPVAPRPVPAGRPPVGLPGGTLGDRLRSVEPIVVPVPEPVTEVATPRTGRVVIGRRRTQPLVAQR